MKGTDNMKEIINKNIDTESNKQIGENTEKDVRTKEKVSVTFLKTAQMLPFKRFAKVIKSILNVILRMI